VRELPALTVTTRRRPRHASSQLAMVQLRTRVRLLLSLLLVCGVCACAQVLGAPPAVSVSLPSALNGNPAPLLVPVIGEAGALGLFDPSLMWSAEWGTFMSYSTVQSIRNVDTRVASFDTATNTWTLRAQVNQASRVSIPCGSGTCSGRAVHETSSLILDPRDPNPARRVKVFTHTFLVTEKNTLKFNFGYISMFTSDRPWADTSATGAPSDGSNEPWPHEALLGWRSASPFSSNASMLLDDIPELKQCMYFREPSAMVSEDELGSRIDLVLGCITLHSGGGGPQIQQVLLRSRDHAASFSFVSVLLTGDDLVRLGFDIATSNGAQLYRDAGGRMVLLVSPEAHFNEPTMAEGDDVDEPGYDGYAGCIVVPFDDERNGTLQRVRTMTNFGEWQLLKVAAYVRTSESGRFCGACSFHAGAHAASGLGILMSTLYPGERTDRFQILASSAHVNVTRGNLSIVPDSPSLPAAAAAGHSLVHTLLAALIAGLALTHRLL